MIRVHLRLLSRTLRDLEAQLVLVIIRLAADRTVEAAQLLGVSRERLNGIIRRLNIRGDLPRCAGGVPFAFLAAPGEVLAGGRRALVQLVMRDHDGVTSAARELGCSPGYVRRFL